MTRLIDAEALVYDFGEIDNGAQKRFDLFVTNEVIAEQPTIDAVPVIRCRDCKYCRTYYHGDNMPFSYACDRMYLTNGLSLDDYCSRAERKEA